jgi:heptosyltransferase-2
MERRILIVKTGALGDVLRTTVLIEGLIDKYAPARIDWITSKEANTLIEGHPVIDKIYYNDSLPQEIFEKHYDLIISLEEKMSLLKNISKISCRQFFGVYEENGILKYTLDSAMWYDMSLVSIFGKNVADELKKHNKFSYPELLYKMLDLKWKKQRYNVYIDRDKIKKNLLEEKLAHKKSVLGIVVGASERWPMKTMPLDKMISLVDEITKSMNQDVQIILISGNGKYELQIQKEAMKMMPGIMHPKVNSLEEFISVINLCNTIITPDTLAMHIGIALRKYVITYFTVTSASEIEIYSGKKIVANHSDYCSYTKENKPRPNIVDAIDIRNIVYELKKVMHKE